MPPILCRNMGHIQITSDHSSYMGFAYCSWENSLAFPLLLLVYGPTDVWGRIKPFPAFPTTLAMSLSLETVTSLFARIDNLELCALSSSASGGISDSGLGDA